MADQRASLGLVLLALLAATADAAWDCESLYQDSPNGWGTRLGKAANENDLQCVKYFLKAGDGPNEENRLSEKPIHYAAQAGAAAVIKVLLDAGGEIDPVSARAENPLMIASCRGQANAVALLVYNGADVDFTNSRGETASSVACTCYRVRDDCPKDAILTLLDPSGPGIPCEDLYKDDPNESGSRLQNAIRAEDLYCTNFFLQQGDNVNIPDNTGRYPIMDAAHTESAAIVKLILNYGAYADKRDSQGFTALMHASCNGFDNDVDILVDSGVKTGFTDSNGQTAADLACTCANSEDCLKDKIASKIGATQLYTYFNVDFKSDDGVLNDGSKDITSNNRDCNEKCKNTSGCHSWTRIKRETAENKNGECWLRGKNPSSVYCLECDSGDIQY